MNNTAYLLCEDRQYCLSRGNLYHISVFSWKRLDVLINLGEYVINEYDNLTGEETMQELFITCLFVGIDMLLLLFMVNFHFYLGIPIFKKSVDIVPHASVEDIGFDMSDKIVYKITRGRLLFRSQFTYFNLYTIRFLSIIKGDVRIVGDKAIITQRANLTTVYMIGLCIYLVITKDVDLLSYIFLGMVCIFTAIFYYMQNKKLSKLCSKMEVYMKEEDRRRQKQQVGNI